VAPAGDAVAVLFACADAAVASVAVANIVVNNLSKFIKPFPTNYQALPRPSQYHPLPRMVLAYAIKPLRVTRTHPLPRVVLT
jgi:hypothetical protein